MPLASRLAAHADAQQVADTVAAVWGEVDGALFPIIGRRGVAALYNRSLHLCEAGYPWLSEGHRGGLNAMDTDALRTTLASRTSEAAAQAAAAHFQSFQELLASLVGPRLTERLLGSVWASTPSGSAAQDTLP